MRDFGGLAASSNQGLSKEGIAKQIATQGECCKPERLPEIPHQAEALLGNADRLSERIAHLETRLCAVLVCSAPAETKASHPQASTPLGELLRGLDTRLRLMIDAVDSITARLEL